MRARRKENGSLFPDDIGVGGSFKLIGISLDAPQKFEAQFLSSSPSESATNTPSLDLSISALTITEIRRGILEKPRRKKRDALDAWFSGPEGPQELFTGRIFSFDDKAGLIWARLMAEGKAAGRPRSVLNMIIASVAGARCLIPRFDGVILSKEWKDALWDRFVTEAPRPRTPSEQQYSDRKLRSRR